MKDKFERLARVARKQRGLFTHQQAMESGFSPSTIGRLARTGRWVRVLRGVYRVAGTPPDELEHIVAGWLACGEPSAIYGLGAAATWKLDVPVPDEATIVLPWHRQSDPTGVTTIRTRRWSPTEMVLVGNLRATSPMRTLLDLARDTDELDLELMLDEAHRRGLVQLERLEGYLLEAATLRVSGARRLLRLVRERDPSRPTDSGGETKLLSRIRRSGLPLPIPRYWIRTSRGPRRIDLAYPEHRVALEYQSYRWHEGRQRFDDDYERDTELADAGWDRRYITSKMVDDPNPALELTIASALGLRPVAWKPITAE